MSNASLSIGRANGVETSDTLTANALMVGSGGKDIAITDTYLIEGTAQTVGAVTGDVITLNLGGTAAGYRLEAMVTSFEATTPAAPGYSVRASVRTDGTSATVIGVQTQEGEADGLTTVDANFVASGNNIILRVDGEAGLTIDWRASLRYISQT